MLTVDDDEFWQGMSPVEFGELPALQDAVTVVGYPIGGDTISVTSGVVSRIEILSYVHGSTELLGLQVRLILLVFHLIKHLIKLYNPKPKFTLMYPDFPSLRFFFADRCCYKFWQFRWTCI